MFSFCGVRYKDSLSCCRCIKVGSLAEFDDMMHIDRCTNAAFCLAVEAQRVLGKIALAELLPLIVVASLCAIASQSIMIASRLSLAASAAALARLPRSASAPTGTRYCRGGWH